MAPKISVIIAVYNAAPYLAECLDSVMGQSLRELEIICVDDGSTDHSADILKSYVDQDERLILISQENQGAGMARNNGLKVAGGEFVCFLDADDYYHDPQALENLYQAAVRNGARVCGGGIMALRDGRLEEVNRHRDQNVFPREGWVRFADFLYVWFYVRYIFQRELIVENNLYFPDYRRGQDPIWCARVLAAAEKFYALPRVVYVYRMAYRAVEWNPRQKADTLQHQLDLMRFALEKGYSSLFDLMEDELYYTADRFRRGKMAPGSKEYWRQTARRHFYRLLAAVSGGRARQKYQRKSEEAQAVLARAKRRD